ncbi:MAG: methyltransferase domain-containing protein [Candidatus Nanopelagicales bacterium]
MSEFAEATSATAKVFDSLAHTYDAVGVDFFQPIAASLCEAMHPHPGEQWLDIGCGRGAVLRAASQALGTTGHITGIDISEAMVSLADEMIRQEQLANASVHVDDGQQPTVAQGTFDAVTSCLVLFFLPRPDLALQAWRPLLKPHGRLGVTTFGPVDARWEHVDEVFKPFVPADMVDARTTGQVGPFASDEAMEALVAASGYREVHTVNAVIDVRFASPQHWYDFSWSTGQRRMWMAVPEDRRARVRAQAEERLMESASKDGSVTFAQAVRHTLATA